MRFPRVRALGEEGRGSEPRSPVREHAQDGAEELVREQPQPIAAKNFCRETATPT